MLPVYYSFNEYVLERFGEKLYKLSLNAGFTCPNRDGTKGRGGCIFCSAGGSGDFSEAPCEDIDVQIENAKKQVRSKFSGEHFIAYFQAFTNTYAPVERLREIFCKAVNNPCIAAVSVATRPDCLPEEVIALLSELNHIKPVFVELGLQTIHESTAQLINRCYPLSDYDRAVRLLKQEGINTVVHLILGLPGETEEMVLQSVRYVVDSKADGIKLQLLHVLKGTKLEQMYQNREFEVLSLEEYTDLLVKCVELIPNNIVIHRLTGDAPKKLLVAPLWSADKKRVLNCINARLRSLNDTKEKTLTAG